MRVPVQQHVARAQRRQVVLMPEVSVRRIDRMLPGKQQAVICHHRELHHHLVDLGVAVAANAEHQAAALVEHGGDFHRRVFLRQSVARPVVQDIAQQQKPIGSLAVKGFEQASAPICRAVDVGCDHQFHSYHSPML